MSGHSKWSTIKRAKGITDAKRGALFTKVAREISVAARQGGGDPDANYRLRLAIEKARSVNMPSDNIKRTIDKATGGGEADQFEEIVYEGYGPGGVAVLVEAQTDNRNRTAAEVRSMFAKSRRPAGRFRRRRLAVRAARPDRRPARAAIDADEVALTAIDAGAEDVDTEGDETIEIYTSPADLETVRQALEDARASPSSRPSRRWSPSRRSSSTRRRPARRSAWSSCSRTSTTCQRVTANFDIPEDVFAEVAG